MGSARRTRSPAPGVLAASSKSHSAWLATLDKLVEDPLERRPGQSVGYYRGLTACKAGPSSDGTWSGRQVVTGVGEGSADQIAGYGSCGLSLSLHSMDR